MAEIAASASYRPHVLLVENDECTLRVVQTLLQKCGYKVTVARDGQQAVDVLRSHHRERIDLVLTDHLMPKVDGLGVLAEVVSSRDGHTVPVIVMSTQASQDFIWKAYQAGAVDYMEKPIRYNEVVTMWQHVWESSYRPQSDQTAAKEPSAMDTGTFEAQDNSGGISQDNSSGCEGQSSCTVMAPSAKRSREEGNTITTTSPLMTMGSLESSALNFGKGHIDVVEDSERHLPTASMGDTEMTECNGTHVVAMRPHDPPLFSSIEPSIQTIIPRIFSAPSMLAAQANYQTAADTNSARKRPHEVASSSEDAAPAETENDSGNSAATAEDAACPAIDTSPFTAFSKLSGCDTTAVSSSVQLEIAPLDLTPWPSTTSNLERLGSLGRQASLAQRLSSIKEEEAGAAAASLCMLAKAFAATAPSTCPHSAPPLLQPLKVSTSIEVSSRKSSTPKEKSAREGGSTPVGPSHAKQHQAFGKALRSTADLQSGATQGDHAVWAANRKAALEKLRKKKKLRSFRKKVRYESRRRLAESRPRIRGQFIKAGAEVPLSRQSREEGSNCLGFSSSRPGSSEGHWRVATYSQHPLQLIYENGFPSA